MCDAPHFSSAMVLPHSCTGDPGSLGMHVVRERRGTVVGDRGFFDPLDPVTRHSHPATRYRDVPVGDELAGLFRGTRKTLPVDQRLEAADRAAVDLQGEDVA